MLSAAAVKVGQGITKAGKAQNGKALTGRRRKNRQNVPLGGIGLLFGDNEIYGANLLSGKGLDLLHNTGRFARTRTAE